MSQINIYERFASYGSKMKILGIIALVNIVFSFLFFLFPLLFLAMFGLIFLSLILIFLALKPIKQIGSTLKSKALLSYRSKYLTGFIFSFFGLFMFIIGYGNILGGEGRFIFSILMAGLGFFFLLIDIILEIKAWNFLRENFAKSQIDFPEEIINNIQKGIKYQKFAVLSLLLTFFIITIPLLFVFRAIGYLKLGKIETLRYTQQTAEAPPTIQAQIESTPTTSLEPTRQTTKGELQLTNAKDEDYCPHCGEPITGFKKFCGRCGFKL